MEHIILYTKTDEKGREFKILGNLEYIQQRIAELEFHSDEVDLDLGYTNEEQFFNDIISVSSYLGESGWEKTFEKIPLKKNGTFAKGRVQILYRMKSLSQIWEDSYGWAAPELRLKTISDNEVELQFGTQVEKW